MRKYILISVFYILLLMQLAIVIYIVPAWMLGLIIITIVMSQILFKNNGKI